MVEPRLRFRDLKRLGIVDNRQSLANWIRHHGFPPGQLTGPNSRTWGETEVQEYLANRPTAPKPAPRRNPQVKGRGRAARSAGLEA